MMFKWRDLLFARLHHYFSLGGGGVEVNCSFLFCQRLQSWTRYTEHLGTGHKLQVGVGWKKSGGGPSFSCMKKGVGQEKSYNTLGVGHE